MRRLPGGLAHADIACLIGRLVAYRAGNDRRFLPVEVDFVTGAAGGIATIVTSAAVLDWDGERFALSSVHAGATREEAIAGCGFALDAPAQVPVTELPPPEAVKLLREVIDPHAMRRLETRVGPGRGAPRARGDRRDGSARGAPCTTVNGRSARFSRRAPSSSPTARSFASRTRR